jgi:hypothetical protein
MKVVQLETTPEVRGLEHRGGTFHARTIVEGKPGTPGHPLKQYTTVYVEANERATIEASEETLLLHYGLPDLSDLEATGHTSGTLQAAE